MKAFSALLPIPGQVSSSIYCNFLLVSETFFIEKQVWKFTKYAIDIRWRWELPERGKGTVYNMLDIYIKS